MTRAMARCSTRATEWTTANPEVLRWLRIGYAVACVAAAILRRLAPGGFALTLVLFAGTGEATAPPEAVGSLYLEQDHSYLCTASVVAGPELGLEVPLAVLTAAHCIEDGLRLESTSNSWSSRLAYEISLDGRSYYPVQPLRVGFVEAGFDLAIMVFLEGYPAVQPLHMGSWDQVDFGTAIHNYANPLGMGIQYFTGAVTMLRLEGTAQNQQGWQLNAVASLQVGPGSSGSLILDEASNYIGVLSGVVEAGFGSPFTIFVPQWKIHEFLTDDRAGRSLSCALCLVRGHLSRN